MKSKHIALMIFDFDGVLTDNRVWVTERGAEAVCCNRADGLGFDMLRAAGIPCLILSTERNPVVARMKRNAKTSSGAQNEFQMDRINQLEAWRRQLGRFLPVIQTILKVSRP